MLLCLLMPLTIARLIPHNKPLFKPFILMLCPAGDAQHMGRNIGNTFEHSIALKWTYALKEIITKNNDNITVIITHTAGESIDQLQLASFANRVAPDLFLKIGWYEQTDAIPSFFLYHFSYDDTFIKAVAQDTLYTYDQAHLFSYNASKSYAQQLYQFLALQNTQKSYILHQPYQLPFKPLIGITCPALACEIGIKESSDWQLYVEPIAQALECIITEQGYS